MQEVFDLYRINILASGDDDVLLSVDQENETVLISLRHIARVQPSLLVEDFCRGNRIIVVAGHDAGAKDGKFADLLGFSDLIVILVDDLALPAKSRHADRADLVNILGSEMYAAWSDRLGETIIRIVKVIREIFFPVLDHAGRYRLGTNVHKSPLLEIVILKFQSSGVQSVQNVLSPRDEEPYDGAALI